MLTPGIISIVLGLWLTTQLGGAHRRRRVCPRSGVRAAIRWLRQQQQSLPMGLWQMLRTTMLQTR